MKMICQMGNLERIFKFFVAIGYFIFYLECGIALAFYITQNIISDYAVWYKASVIIMIALSAAMIGMYKLGQVE